MANLPNSEIALLKAGLSKLGQELVGEAHHLQAYFLQKTRHAVSYPDKDYREKVQAKLDHSATVFAIANQMAAFESLFPKRFWTKILRDANVTVRLKAYRHIRFSAINGFTGNRASENRVDFDKIMSSSSPLLGVIEHDNEKFVLNLDAVHHFQPFVHKQWERAVVRVHQL